MKRIFLALITFFLGSSVMETHAANGTNKTLWDFTVKAIDGQEVSLKKYEGHVVMIVNVASRCGFTPQYEGLEALYNKYKDQGFVILGFPSNDFMGQEPGTDEEIKKFCKLNYNVDFPLFSKAPVTGDEKQPVFKFLTDESAENLQGRVLWNFEKFLVNKKGEVVERYRSITGPSSSKISEKIEELLNQ